MTNDKLKKDIYLMLKSSTITDHQKRMIRLLLPSLSYIELSSIHTTLKNEQEEIHKLNQKEKRIIMKFTIMAEKLASLKLRD